MNEWSPSGTYSRPTTPNPQSQLKTFRSHCDEPNNDRTKIPNLFFRAVTDSRSRDLQRQTFQHRSTEATSRTSLTSPSRRKKGDGTADTRFKRKIPMGMNNDACVGTCMETNDSSSPTRNEAKKTIMGSTLGIPTEYEVNNLVTDVQEKDIPLKLSPRAIHNHGAGKMEFSNLVTQDPSEFEIAQNDHLSEVDKLTFEPGITFPKKSASDCTLGTRNTSLGSEGCEENLPLLLASPSATRLAKVHNWIKDHRPKPEKRRSVITVIGQTQGKPILRSSSTLHEIDQRRKLAKELDRHALCKKIIESPESDANNLTTKLNFISASRKNLYCGDRKYAMSNFRDVNPESQKDFGDLKERQHETPAPSLEEYGKCEIMGSESETPVNHSSKRISAHKRGMKKVASKTINNLKGQIQRSFSHITYQALIYFMIILSGALCWFTIFALQENCYFPFDLLSSKPKSTSWYEKLFTWIWDLFRPASSYQRSTPWNVH